MTASYIHFKDPMIRALQDGRKHQTRRVVKPQPPTGSDAVVYNPSYFEPDRGWYWKPFGGFSKCPYGQPGDLLWVREKFSYLDAFDFFNPAVPDEIPPAWYWADGSPEWGGWTKPKPSIHMPRWASRLTLRLTDVRVERVREISEADAQAEGVVDPEYIFVDDIPTHSYAEAFLRRVADGESPLSKHGLDAWVWVLAFHVIHANVDDVLADPEKHGVAA